MSKSELLTGVSYYPRAGVICRYKTSIEGEFVLLQKTLRTIFALLCSYRVQKQADRGVVYSNTPLYSESNAHDYKNAQGNINNPKEKDYTRRLTYVSEGQFAYTAIEPALFERISHVNTFNTTLQEQVYLVRWYCQCIEALLTNFHEAGIFGFLKPTEIYTHETEDDYTYSKDTCGLTVKTRRMNTIKLTGDEDLF